MSDPIQAIRDLADAAQLGDQADADYLTSIADERTHTRVSQHSDSEYTAWTDQNGAAHIVQVVP
jgi:hypothetical protein